MKCLIVVLLMINISLAKKYQRCELAKELNEKHDIAIKHVGMFVCVAEVRSSLNTEAVNSGLYYGLYQLNSEFWCSQTDESGGGCKVKCIDLADDDIIDDIKCAKQIISEQGFDAWGLSEACQLTSRNITKECFGIELDSIVDESTSVLGNTTLMNENESVVPTDASDVTYFERDSIVESSTIKQSTNTMEETNTNIISNTMIESTERSLIDSSITPSSQSVVIQSTTEFVQKSLESEQNKFSSGSTLNEDLKNSTVSEGIVEMSESYVKMVKSSQENASQKNELSNTDGFTWEKKVEESSSTESHITIDDSDKESTTVQSKTYLDNFSWEQKVDSTLGDVNTEESSTESNQSTQIIESSSIQSKTYPDNFSWEQTVDSTEKNSNIEESLTESHQATQITDSESTSVHTNPDNFSWEKDVNSTDLQESSTVSYQTTQIIESESSTIQSKTYLESSALNNDNKLTETSPKIKEISSTENYQTTQASEAEVLPVQSKTYPESSKTEINELASSVQLESSKESKQTKTYPESSIQELMSENSVTESNESSQSVPSQSSIEQKQTKTYPESFVEQIRDSTLSESSANESTASYVTEQETTENFVEPSTVRTYVLISRGTTNNEEVESTTTENVLEAITTTSDFSVSIDEPTVSSEPKQESFEFVRESSRAQKGFEKEEETTLTDNVEPSTVRTYVMISRGTTKNDELELTATKKVSGESETILETSEKKLFGSKAPAKKETFEFIKESSRSSINSVTEQETTLDNIVEPSTTRSYVLISRTTTRSDEQETTSTESSTPETTMKQDTFGFVRESSRSPINLVLEQDTTLENIVEPSTIKNYVLISRGTTKSEDVESTSTANVINDSSNARNLVSDDAPLKQETFEFIKESSRTPKAIQKDQNEELRTLSESAHSENLTASSIISETSTEKDNESTSTTEISPVKEFVDLVEDKIRSIKSLDVGDSLTLKVDQEVTPVMMTMQDSSSTKSSIEPSAEPSIKVAESTTPVSSIATTSTSDTESTSILKLSESSTSSETERTITTLKNENLTITQSSTTIKSPTTTENLETKSSTPIESVTTTESPTTTENSAIESFTTNVDESSKSFESSTTSESVTTTQSPTTTEMPKTTHQISKGIIESDFGRLSTKKMQEHLQSTASSIESTTPTSEDRISVKVIYDETVSYSTSSSSQAKETTVELTTDSTTERSTVSSSETFTKPIQNENNINNKIQEEIMKSYRTNLENQMKQINRQQKSTSLEMKSDSKMFQPIIYNFFTFNFNGNGTNEMPMLDFKQFPFTNTIKMENKDQKMEITQHFPMEAEKEV